METVLLEEKDDKYIISVDKSTVDAKSIYNFIEQLRFEQLSKKAGYNEAELEAFGKEIKKGWWENNKWWISKGMEDYKKQNEFE